MSNIIKDIQLFSVCSDVGYGANDGAFYPAGLLTIASHIKRKLPEIDIMVVDRHHDFITIPKASIVGISASSVLSYKNVLKCAQEAKCNGSITVLGGPHATALADQIMKNQEGLVDYIIRGKGEIPFEELIKAIISDTSFDSIKGLSWRNGFGKVIHNSIGEYLWRYDDYLPLKFNLLSKSIHNYWERFQKNINQKIDATFVVFTHFGCGYRDSKLRMKTKHEETSWCCYCSLNDSLLLRDPRRVVNEALAMIKENNISYGSNILLKCYGDNIGHHAEFLEKLSHIIRNSQEWNKYNIMWTFYCQSVKVSKHISELLLSVNAKYLYIGFDSVDEKIQRINNLGTSIKNHINAAENCRKYGIKIQAGFVFGCIGETKESIEKTITFANDLVSRGLLERINSSVMFIIPGSRAYELLCKKEHWIKSLDVFDSEELQFYWVKHFCSELSKDPKDGLRILKDAAQCLDKLSPGVHSSMGYEKNTFNEDK
ncbi:MAG: B12-binding domain-containing radical SAM protein [Eubacteriaceae bacterium]|nr:B12-binding domain-containing radical SAM protein [Eubacteriaceae bacterium]